MPDPATPPAPTLGPAQLSLVSQSFLPDGEWSAVVPVGEDVFLLAHDEDGIHLWSPGAGTERLVGPADDPRLRDLEGLCLSDDARFLFAVNEATGDVFRLTLQMTPAVSLSELLWVARIETLGSEGDHAWEGAAWLPARFCADGQARLVLVHEDDPKAVVLVDPIQWTVVEVIELEGEVDAALGDVSDVAVCPVTGNLFLLSDKSETLVEVALTADPARLRPLSVHTLPVANKAKPEGVAFTPAGDLVIVTDASHELFRFTVTRTPS